MANFQFNPDAPLDRVLYLADGRESPETIRANKALLDYYELGDERTTHKLANFYKRCDAANPDHPDFDHNFKPPAYNTLNKWSSDFKWAERIKAEDLLRARRIVQTSREQHLKKIENLRQQCEDAGSKFMEASLMTLELLLEGVQSVDASKMTVRDISALITGLNTGLNGAIEMKSRALGIEKLLQNLPNSEQN